VALVYKPLAAVRPSYLHDVRPGPVLQTCMGLTSMEIPTLLKLG